jgi:hypothetical protein
MSLLSNTEIIFPHPVDTTAGCFKLRFISLPLEGKGDHGSGG